MQTTTMLTNMSNAAAAAKTAEPARADLGGGARSVESWLQVQLRGTFWEREGGGWGGQGILPGGQCGSGNACQGGLQQAAHCDVHTEFPCQHFTATVVGTPPVTLLHAAAGRVPLCYCMCCFLRQV